MSEKTGLDYWLESDAWKDTQVADWSAIEYYVDEGLLTERDRDLLHAYGSMVATSPDGVNDIDEVNDAWSKYLDVKEEHPVDEIEVEDPDIEDGPKDGEDYSKDSPVDVPGEDKIEVAETPEVPGGGDGNKGGDKVIAVNTKALRKFAENVEALRVMIADSKKHLADVDVKPGGFNAAYTLRDKVNGAGLKGDYEKYMYSLAQELGELSEATKTMLADYEKAEDLNKLSAEKLTNIMNGPFSYINNTSK